MYCFVIEQLHLHYTTPSCTIYFIILPNKKCIWSFDNKISVKVINCNSIIMY